MVQIHKYGMNFNVSHTIQQVVMAHTNLSSEIHKETMVHVVKHLVTLSRLNEHR